VQAIAWYTPGQTLIKDGPTYPSLKGMDNIVRGMDSLAQWQTDRLLCGVD